MKYINRKKVYLIIYYIQKHQTRKEFIKRLKLIELCKIGTINQQLGRP